MRVLAFGTYDVAAHPRVQVLIDGLRAHGVSVAELDHPLGLSTAERVRILRQPWRLPVLAARLASRWALLAAGSLRYRGTHRPDAVLVGYLGHFDVLLARALFPRGCVVLDHLIFAANTAADRGAGQGLRTRLLDDLDRLAISAADVVVVDTEEHRAMVPAAARARAVVAPVGATTAWFDAGRAATRSDAGRPADGCPDAAADVARSDANWPADGRPDAAAHAPLSVVFYGLFTPLQGTPTIGQAVRLLHDRGAPVRVTLIGSGQDADVVRAAVRDVPGLTWHDWVDAAELPAVVAAHDVSLGIFGTTEKAMRVVPNKVYQGIAAGTAVITSDTPPQRRALGDAVVYVPPGDADALADALTTLAADRGRVAELRRCSARLAENFTAAAVAAPLTRALER